MVDGPTRSRGHKARGSSLHQAGALQRGASYARNKAVSSQDAYLFALRVAFLAYLLLPRQRRVQHVPAANQKVPRTSTSATDMLRDFSLIKDTKSTRFPHGFMSHLDTRITGVLIGREKLPEYNDPLVKRTFAVFLNAFKEVNFRKNVEKDRRVEDLLLIFFSNATKELQKGKAREDDSYKLMVDRHVALFIRLLSSVLRDHGWGQDRPELANRLQTMEKKLLVHDQDLTSDTQRNGGAGGKTIEVEVPRSYELRDMPLGLTVQRIFRKSYDDVQADIVAYRPLWTERAALQDLKSYQANLSLHNKKTLSNDDFDSEEAYELWKKSEMPDISQMMLAIIQSDPELAKETNTSFPQFKHANNEQFPGYDNAAAVSEPPQNLSEPFNDSVYGFDQPVDMSAFYNSNHVEESVDNDDPYTYIPPDTRAYYRAILKTALSFDMQNSDEPGDPTMEHGSVRLLAKPSTELLSECALRWRLPQSSRPVLFLDVIREKYQHEEINLDTLDAAFIFVKVPQQDVKRPSNRQSLVMSQLESLSDWHKWTLADYALHNSCYSALRDSLLRDLFSLLLSCFDTKAPQIGPVMYVLNEHIYADPLFNADPEPSTEYTQQLQLSLQERAMEVYHDMVKTHIPIDQRLELYHVIELGKAVVKLCDKIQKRYRKNPEIMGINPLQTLVRQIFPAYAADAKQLVTTIAGNAEAEKEEIPVQDGFDLYKELVEIRRVHTAALPNVPFGFQIEEQLQDFVWRYIKDAGASLSGWVEEAVKMDDFQCRAANRNQGPTDEERHSVSAIDVFRSFNSSADQVLQLEWDDDLQYAKFMTAISKSISQGICRYAELLETRFAKELDTLTPEQEASKDQTRQEKWMQMARDAWVNEKRIEPFQFTSESLVKLNNIEWSTVQLDALSRKINVDACADVIEAKTPTQLLQQRLREKNIQNVFTIKIIEAEDLKACDLNGLSDPYLVLGDEFQKRLYKTRVIYRNLNPRWDESIDITTSGALNLIATVWDHDTLGDHDCVGRTSLKLDPSHFRDYVPREYWLDLDTQGRVLLRVSMEGERDDIRFWFGKGMRGLKRAEREMTRGIVDKLSAYIHHCLSLGALKRLLGKKYTEQVGAVTSMAKQWFANRTQAGAPQPAPVSNAQKMPTSVEIDAALRPLFTYFDESFAIMKETLTDSAMIAVMTRVWKEVLNTMEGLLVPPLSDKPSLQKQLTQVEMDVVFKWLELLFAFFHAVDEDTGQAHGVPIDVLKSAKYHDLCNLAFFYFEQTENLIQQSEYMASAANARQKEAAARSDRLSTPSNVHGGAGNAFAFGGIGGQYGLPSTRRSKTIMLSRNLGTMRKAKEEKRKEAQAVPSDDMILRILRMRPEAERYLRDRSRQKERLQAAAAAEQIVRQSLAQGMANGGGIQRGLPRR